MTTVAAVLQILVTLRKGLDRLIPHSVVGCQMCLSVYSIHSNEPWHLFELIWRVMWLPSYSSIPKVLSNEIQTNTQLSANSSVHCQQHIGSLVLHLLTWTELLRGNFQLNAHSFIRDCIPLLRQRWSEPGSLVLRGISAGLQAGEGCCERTDGGTEPLMHFLLNMKLHIKLS